MNKLLFSLLMLVIASTALAQDSGLYYNPDRDGEGLSLHRNGDVVVALLFTYGGTESETPAPIPPYISPQVPLEEPLNGQRWFLISGDTLVDDTYAEGVLYSTGGINYPVPLLPNGIGAAVPVGKYVLTRSGDGWELLVVPLDDGPLLEDDPLFEVDFQFEERLFRSKD